MLLRERTTGRAGAAGGWGDARSAEIEVELGDPMRALGDREEGAVAALTKELNVYTDDEVGAAGTTGAEVARAAEDIIPSGVTSVGVALREGTSGAAGGEVENKSDGAELDLGSEASSGGIVLAV